MKRCLQENAVLLQNLFGLMGKGGNSNVLQKKLATNPGINPHNRDIMFTIKSPSSQIAITMEVSVHIFGVISGRLFMKPKNWRCVGSTPQSAQATRYYWSDGKSSRMGEV